MTDARALHDHANDLPRAPAPGSPLVARLADARLVLLGEASHGTREFYELRAEVTKRLIEDHGFDGVAIEGDWPDAAEVDRFVRGRSPEPDARAALGGFRRFPLWMWRNRTTQDFVAWLRERNAAAPPDAQARFFGLDLYSLQRSIEVVLEHLDAHDPAAGQRARERYACFDHTAVDGQRYGYGAVTGREESCEDHVVEQLVDLQRSLAARPDSDPDDVFDASRNAALVAGAEAYYRAMYRGRDRSWNLRDEHMVDTLAAALEHLGRTRERPRLVVWAHNSHLGDARATEMGRRGEVNLGQRCRERFDDTVLVGMTTHTGEVSAASDWGADVERKRVRPSLPGSYERLFHATGRGRFWLDLHDPEVVEVLREPRLERAIGVIYRPETERVSHYFGAHMADQFDVVVHVDDTTALEPLEVSQAWSSGEPADTYPWAV